jgi:hypothetical protein
VRPCAHRETVGDASQGCCCLASKPARHPHLGPMSLAFGFEPSLISTQNGSRGRPLREIGPQRARWDFRCYRSPPKEPMRAIEHLLNLSKRSRDEFRRKYCLHPEAPVGCSNISAAHSVQRAMLKKFLAEDGHVVKIAVTPQVDPNGMFIGPERIGVNKATTFYGFCNTHDAKLFAPLENEDFTASPKQIALLGYRAVSREMYQKDAEIAAANAVRDYAAVCPDITNFREKDRAHKALLIARLNARANLREAKSQFAGLLSDDGDLRYYAIEFAEPPVYFCSVAFLPEWDFQGSRLQDLSFISVFRPMCFSAWAIENRSVVVFCWHKSGDEVCEPFVNSLRRSNHLVWPTAFFQWRLRCRITSCFVATGGNQSPKGTDN